MLNNISIEELLKISSQAGLAILDIYHQDFDVEFKQDNSPLTLADKKSNHIIISMLSELYPEIPYISEETKLIPYEQRKDWEYFWLIDPLDGTKEFVKKNGEFTINIALVYKTEPILGIVYAPAKNKLYYALRGQGCFKVEGSKAPIAIHARRNRSFEKLIVVGSRSHADNELEKYVNEMKQQYQTVEFIAAGSSLKFCLIAEGKADVYPRTGPTMEWDTAAGHVIALESGKQVLQFNSEIPLSYNKKDLLNSWFIVR